MPQGTSPAAIDGAEAKRTTTAWPDTLIGPSKRTAERQAVEPELVAQQPCHHFATDRGGQVVDGGRDDVRAHDRAHPSRDRRLEGLEGVQAGVLARDRKRQVGVNGRVAVTREVL